MGAPTAVASDTSVCGSSAIMKIASSARGMSTTTRVTSSVVSSVAGVSGIVVSSKVGEAVVGPVLGRPVQCELTEWLNLVVGDRIAAVQLEHGEEARDDDATLVCAGDELAERHRLPAPEKGDDDRRLLADADERRVQ